MINKRLTNAIKDYFDSNNITQRNYAKKLNLNESLLSHYVTGRREMSYELLSQIATDMDIDLNYIFKNSSTIEEKYKLTETEKAFIMRVRKLAPEEREKLYDMLNYLITNHDI